MSWKVQAEKIVSCAATDFYSGVEVWLTRPQVINRRLLGCVEVYSSHAMEHTTTHVHINDGCGASSEVLYGDCLSSLVSCVLSEEGGARSRVIVRRMLPRMRNMAESLEAVVIDEDCHTVTFCPLDEQCHAHSTILPGSYRLQLVTTADTKIILSTWILPDDKLDSPSVKDSATPTNGVTTPTLEWLKAVLLPKVCQWSEENKGKSLSSGRGKSLVPLSRYSQLYRELKSKYGELLVKSWPEATDPQKFVYEDIAIATYLLVLWEVEREELGLRNKQSFVDLGCGNGLLVYLLSAEGHPGKGIDLRARKIWRMFRDKATLEVSTLTPSDETLFPNFDWLLGNHSDELTPWIPVMAGRSSYHTRYFVLPCCPHDFETKYRRRDSDRSQYRSYLDYVREIGENMGFKVQEDTMRIPSSKRVCQVGRCRSYLSTDENEVDKKRMTFLEHRCPSRTNSSPIRSLTSTADSDKASSTVLHCTCQTTPPPALHIVATAELISKDSSRHEESISISASESLNSKAELNVASTEAQPIANATIGMSSKWASGFQPRSSTEHVRNCTLVDRDVRALVVKRLTSVLLETDNYLRVKCLRSVRGPTENRVEESLLQWNLGGQLPLSRAVMLLDAAVLNRLKREFGGLQTLLRNEHQVFEVYGGQVHLRNWSKLNQPASSKRSKNPNRSQSEAVLLRKTKSCWFYHYHAQGCPRLDTDCPYAHGDHELRQRPDFTVQTLLSDF